MSVFTGAGSIAPGRLVQRHLVERARTGAHGPMVSAGGSPLGEGLPTLDRSVCWKRVSAPVGRFLAAVLTKQSALAAQVCT